ncbi:MAG: hypothetical protein PHU08_06495 [Dehalococcoidales bacterium]|nr:hypothetical protein [Dehalococcoidales bacterium]
MFDIWVDAHVIEGCYNRNMIEGKCTKCGTNCVGWALLLPRHQSCPRCGAPLEISDDGRSLGKGYSPFTAERYIIKLPTKPRVLSEEAGEKPEGT